MFKGVGRRPFGAARLRQFHAVRQRLSGSHSGSYTLYGPLSGYLNAAVGHLRENQQEYDDSKRGEHLGKIM